MKNKVNIFLADDLHQQGIDLLKKKFNVVSLKSLTNKELILKLKDLSPKSDSLTAVTLPGGIPTGKLIEAMKNNYGVQIANGQAEMKDKIARFSHMGDLEMNDFVELNKLLVKEFNNLKN